MKDAKLGFVAGIAFGLGLLIGSMITITVRPSTSELAWCEERLATYKNCVCWTPIPTGTSHVCPALPEPCPTVYYKMLPDVQRTLTSLSLADYEFELVDAKLENYIQATEGEYDWNLIAILSLHRSAHNYMLEASDDVINWFTLGELTCEGSE